MKPSLKMLLSGGGAVALAVFCSGTAMAQYYNDGYGRRYERPGYDRGYNRGYDRGYDRRRYDDRRYGGDYRRGPDPHNPLAGMSIEDQKRAIKNHRRAQKKAFKRGYIMP
jgi:hypothetical protein